MTNLAEPTTRMRSSGRAAGTSMKIIKLGEHVGAEVTGIDLRQPVDEDTRRKLNDAIVEHIALVIRDQHFTRAQFLDACRVFGTPVPRPTGTGSLEGDPFVHLVSSRQVDPNGVPQRTGTRWHTDHTNLKNQNYTLLYATELPASGGGTSVCSMREGYKVLPEALRARVDTMQTVNVIMGSAARFYGRGLAHARTQQNERKPTPMIHPLVRTHPVNGTRALYFNPLKTENIVGMSPEESQDLMELLIEKAVHPEFTYTHQWRLGDMFLWDNRSSLHKAGDDYEIVDGNHRTLMRVITADDEPFRGAVG